MLVFLHFLKTGAGEGLGMRLIFIQWVLSWLLHKMKG